MTITTADIFAQMHAFALSMGLRRAAGIVRAVKRVQEAPARERAYAQSWAVDLIWQDMDGLRRAGADPESMTALIDAALGDSSELAGLRAELIAKLREEAACNVQEPGEVSGGD